MIFKKLTIEDISQLKNMLEDCNVFKRSEIDCCLEILYETAQNPSAEEYYVFCSVEKNIINGFICFGQDPIAKNVWEVYWVLIAEKFQKQGIGKKLYALFEWYAKAHHVRLICVETSSSSLYNPARNFYKTLGFKEMANIKDYYDKNDNKIIFCKYFNQEGY